MKWILIIYTLYPSGVQIEEIGSWDTESQCVQVAELREYKNWACISPPEGKVVDVWIKENE